MGRILFPFNSVELAAANGPLLMAIGLAGLLASAWLPVPLVTAMSVLALGATEVTLDRFGRSPAIVPIIILHTAAYTGLYGLFIGATLHLAAAAQVSLPRVWPTLDIAASIVPMALASHHVLISLRQQFAPKR